jgi:hypothetical protein
MLMREEKFFQRWCVGIEIQFGYANTSTPACGGTGSLSVSTERPSTLRLPLDAGQVRSELRTSLRSGLEKFFDEVFVDAGEEGEFVDGDEFVF